MDTTVSTPARPQAPTRRDAAFDAWLRQSLQASFGMDDEVPECLLRLCAQVDELRPC